MVSSLTDRTHDELVGLPGLAVCTLGRDEVRRFVYDCQSEVAAVDGIDPSEAQMLSWLRHEGDIEAS